jgi:hypothetical protein
MSATGSQQLYAQDLLYSPGAAVYDETAATIEALLYSGGNSNSISGIGFFDHDYHEQCPRKPAFLDIFLCTSRYLLQYKAPSVQVLVCIIRHGFTIHHVVKIALANQRVPFASL